MQTAYSEFYFTNVLWPDFGKKDIENALIDYSRRNRVSADHKRGKCLKTELLQQYGQSLFSV